MASGFAALLTVELHFPEAGSLKGKRHFVRSAKDNLRNRFGASVAEVDHHDLWQRSRMTMAVVRREHAETRRALADAERYLSAQEYELVGATVTVLSVDGDL